MLKNSHYVFIYTLQLLYFIFYHLKQRQLIKNNTVIGVLSLSVTFLLGSVISVIIDLIMWTGTFTHMSLDDEVLDPLHDEGRALGHEFGEHGHSLSAPTLVLAPATGSHLGVCSVTLIVC